MAGSSQSPPKPYIRKGIFKFLELPAEIRNRVYKLNLHTESEVTFGLKTNKTELNINVIFVCKEIYREAIGFAYQDRCWCMDGPAAIWKRDPHSDRAPTFNVDYYLSSIRDETRPRIEKIRLIVYGILVSKEMTASFVLKNPPELQCLRGLDITVMFLCRDHKTIDQVSRGGVNLRDAPYVTGLVYQILGQVPTHIPVHWFAEFNPNLGFDIQTINLDAQLTSVAEKYKRIQGCEFEVDESRRISN